MRPWKYENIPGKDRHGFAAHLHRVADAETNLPIVSLETRSSEDQPWGRLIAAAPEMAEALSILVGHMAASRHLYAQEWYDDIARARALLRRIDGGTDG